MLCHFYHALPCMGLQVLFAPYRLVYFFSIYYLTPRSTCVPKANKAVCQRGWSKKRTICLSSFYRRLFNMLRIVTIILAFIQAFSSQKYWPPQGYDAFAKRALQHGNLLLPITMRASFVACCIHCYSLLKYWAPQGYDGFAKRAKQHGNLLLPITMRASFVACCILCYSLLRIFPFGRATSEAS